MDLQLKQNEVEAAIKSYLDNRGISTKDKNVKVEFTVKRKLRTILADVSIEDAASEAVKTVTNEPAKADNSAAVEEATQAPQKTRLELAREAQNAELPEDKEADTEVAAEAKPATNSLFTPATATAH